MEGNQNKNQKPLTEQRFLELLTIYTQEILLPAMDKRFVNKKEFKDFKNKTLKGQDKILKKLDILLTEKEVRKYEEKKHKKCGQLLLKH